MYPTLIGSGHCILAVVPLEEILFSIIRRVIANFYVTVNTVLHVHYSVSFSASSFISMSQLTQYTFSIQYHLAYHVYILLFYR